MERASQDIDDTDLLSFYLFTFFFLFLFFLSLTVYGRQQIPALFFWHHNVNGHEDEKNAREEVLRANQRRFCALILREDHGAASTCVLRYGEITLMTTDEAYFKQP